MIGLKKLTKEQIKVLRQLVMNTCESCHKDEYEVGILQPHRIKRGNLGGLYVPSNIKMCCDKCHKQLHANEKGIAGR